MADPDAVPTEQLETTEGHIKSGGVFVLDGTMDRYKWVFGLEKRVGVKLISFYFSPSSDDHLQAIKTAFRSGAQVRVAYSPTEKFVFLDLSGLKCFAYEIRMISYTDSRS